jgi:hypothetical protein
VSKLKKYASLPSIAPPQNFNTPSVGKLASKCPFLSTNHPNQLPQYLRPALSEDAPHDQYFLSYSGHGFGKKTDLEHGKHRHNITPGPALYHIDSFVDNDIRHKKGMSMHIGREVTL